MPRQADGCASCAQLRADLKAERARTDKYMDLLARIISQREGVPVTAPSWESPPPPAALPKNIEEAIKARSKPNEPLRFELQGRARDMLAAGVGDSDVAEHILKGEDPDL